MNRLDCDLCLIGTVFAWPQVACYRIPPDNVAALTFEQYSGRDSEYNEYGNNLLICL